MCGEVISFPENAEEFLEKYSFKDKEKVYTNGIELIPVFRVKQMLEHYTRKPMQEIVERLEECGSIWVQYQEIMTKEEIAESVLKQAKEQCIRIVKEVGGVNE